MRIALSLGSAVLALGLLAGCGSADETATPTDDQSSEQTQEPTPSPNETVPNGPIDFTQIALISESNVDGTVDPRAVELDSQAALDEFASQFSGGAMTTSLHREYADADVPDGEALVGAVVDVSCQGPSEVRVEKTSHGVEITGVPTKSKVEVQCIVPVTTVALVSVPEAAV